MDLAITRRMGRQPQAKQTAMRDLAAPGWFTDPSSLTEERFWTGSVWTGLTRARDMAFTESVPGVVRTLFERSVPISKIATRRLAVTTTSIRWGRWEVSTAEVQSIWHWIEESPDDAANDPSKAWHKLVFEAENRVSGLRVKFANVGGSESRQVAWDGYRALLSVSTTVIQPRLAVEYLDKLSDGKEVKIGNLRLSSRGIVQRHVDPRRASLSAHWNDLSVMVDCEGRPLGDPSELARLRDGTMLEPIDASTKNAPVVPLLLWLAKDRFETKPMVLATRTMPEWFERAVS
jgi:Protein of unknown function (DUF2510)